MCTNCKTAFIALLPLDSHFPLHSWDTTSSPISVLSPSCGCFVFMVSCVLMNPDRATVVRAMKGNARDLICKVLVAILLRRPRHVPVAVALVLLVLPRQSDGEGVLLVYPSDRANAWPLGECIGNIIIICQCCWSAVVV